MIESFEAPAIFEKPLEPVGELVVGGISPSAGSGLIEPDRYWPIGSKGRWSRAMDGTIYRNPKKYLHVYIDPIAKTFRCSDTGATYYEAIRDSFLDFGVVSACGVIEVPYEQAEVRFKFKTPDWIYYYSRVWGSYGDTKVGGTYYAAQKGNPDVLWSAWDKRTVKWSADGKTLDWSKGVPVSSINIKRILRYGLWLHWGFAPQAKVPIFDARNPNLSGGFHYPADNNLIVGAGRGGLSWANIATLQKKYDVTHWLWKED